MFHVSKCLQIFDNFAPRHSYNNIYVDIGMLHESRLERERERMRQRGVRKSNCAAAIQIIKAKTRVWVN